MWDREREHIADTPLVHVAEDDTRERLSCNQGPNRRLRLPGPRKLPVLGIRSGELHMRRAHVYLLASLRIVGDFDRLVCLPGGLLFHSGDWHRITVNRIG